VLGGQVHEAETAEVDGRYVLKARADAMEARVAWITLGPDGGVSVEHSSVALDSSVPEDPAVAAASQAWWAAYELAVCEDDWGCLDRVIGTAGTELVGTETALRRGETALGNAVADGLRASTGSDLALINAGALRLNHDLAQGEAITRRTIEELIAYDEPVRVIEISGARLAEILDHSVSGWPGHGRWLQTSGLSFRHVDGQATEVHILTSEGPVALDPAATYRVAVISWLVDPKIGDQDGYGEEDHGGLSMNDVVEDGPMLKEAVSQGLSGQVLAVVEGRVCQDDGPCLVPTP
jgi:5'-nucleotidase